MDEQEFKALRYRFYKLGKKRNLDILKELGKLGKDDDEISHDDAKSSLMEIVSEGRVYDLTQAIEFHEDEVRKEKEISHE
jgi:uncharacterized protein YgfB (UPF0149 family)